MKTQYWLADGKEVDSYGTVWNVHLLDGPHEGPEGVTKAKKIIQGIGLDRGLQFQYVSKIYQLNLKGSKNPGVRILT